MVHRMWYEGIVANHRQRDDAEYVCERCGMTLEQVKQTGQECYDSESERRAAARAESPTECQGVAQDDYLAD